jgi:hypothetical protein
MFSQQRKQLPYFDVTALERAQLLRKTAGCSVESGFIAGLVTAQTLEGTVDGKDAPGSRARKRHPQGAIQRTATNSLVFWHVITTRRHSEQTTAQRNVPVITSAI